MTEDVLWPNFLYCLPSPLVFSSRLTRIRGERAACKTRPTLWDSEWIELSFLPPAGQVSPSRRNNFRLVGVGFL